ncbi:MAG TPA: hypothetical protein VD838_09815 [Anaeromyxobacteraceae bacterium]|nr:hypothetical protein [Anaeromyxobacteraceae bacterium]
MRFRPLHPLALLLALTLGLAGCDDAGTGDFPLTPIGAAFTFSFDADDLVDGAARVDAQGSENVLDGITAQGFTAGEVVRARIEEGSAQVRILQAPGGVNISFLDNVSLRLSGGGTSAEVASAEDVGGGTSMANEAELDVSGGDVADVVTAGPVDATLDVSVDPGIPDGTYRLEVRFDVEVFVEGI